jgi:hypothetical protein
MGDVVLYEEDAATVEKVPEKNQGGVGEWERG